MYQMLSFIMQTLNTYTRRKEVVPHSQEMYMAQRGVDLHAQQGLGYNARLLPPALRIRHNATSGTDNMANSYGLLTMMKNLVYKHY